MIFGGEGMFKKLILLFVLFALPLSIFAQSSGKIKGIIRDKASGEPLPGVNVILEGTKMGAVTDLSGYYVILNVPVGTYSVTASLIGYKKMTYKNIYVSADVTTELNFELEETAIQGEEVVVTAEKPLVEKHITQSYSRVDAEQLANIPVRGTRELLELQPSVIVQDGGVHIRGGRVEEVGYYLDGASITNPMNRGQAVYVIQDAVEEMQVLAGGYTAEYGGANSGIVKTQLKTGTDKYEFSLDFQTDKFADEGKEFLNTYSYREHYFTATFGGPLLNKNLKFFVAVENHDEGDFRKRFSYGYKFENLVDMNPNNPRVTDGNPDTVAVMEYPDGFTPRNSRNRWALNSTLLYDFKPFRFRLSTVYNWTKTHSDGTPMLNILNSRHGYWIDKNLLLTGTITHVLSPTTYYDLKFNYFTTESETHDDWFDTDWWKWADSAAVADYTNGKARYRKKWYEDYPYMFYGFNFPRDGARFFGNYVLEKQNYIGGAFSFVSQLGKYHEIKVGGDMRRYTIRRYSISSSVMRLASLKRVDTVQVDDSTVKYVPIYQSIDELKDTVMKNDTLMKQWRQYLGNFYGYDEFGNELDEGFDGAKHPTFGAFYIQDKIEYKHLIVNAGLRVDYFDTDDRKLKDPANPPVDEKNGIIADSGWEDRDPTIKVSPRLGFSFPASDRTVFYMQYGKFVQMTELNDIYWNSAQYGRQIVTGGYYYISPVGFNIGPISTTSYEIGFRQQLGSVAALDIAGFYKNIKGQTQIDRMTAEGGALIASYDYIRNGDFSTSKGLEFQFNLRRVNRLQMAANYTLTKAEGTGSSEASYHAAAYRKTQKPTIVSPLDYSQTHRGTIMLDYRFDDNDPVTYMRNFGANLVFSFSSGHPYTTVYFPPGGQVSPYDAGVDYLEDTRNRLALEPLNSSTTPWTYRFDLRLDKSFKIVGKYKLTAYVRIYNLLNTKNIINVYPYTGSAEDDGFLSEPDRSKAFIDAYGGERYIDMYKKINLKNRQAYWDATGRDLYGQPRQIMFGIKFSY